MSLSSVGPVVWGAFSPVGSIMHLLHTLEQTESPLPPAHSMCPVPLLVAAWFYSLVLHTVGNMATVTSDAPLFKLNDPIYCFPAPGDEVPGKTDPAQVIDPGLGFLRPRGWDTPCPRARATLHPAV